MICPKCGMHIPLDRQNSYFDGRLIQLIGWEIAAFFITLLTLGICFPWALCKLYGWKIKHTVINGRRLCFDGTGLQLFGTWLKWWFFSLITLGIYAWWLPIKVNQWTVKHTKILDNDGESADAEDLVCEQGAVLPSAAPVPLPRRAALEVPEQEKKGAVIVSVIFMVLTCLCALAEFAAIAANVALPDGAAPFPAWTAFAAMGGLLVFGVGTLIASNQA